MSKVIILYFSGTGMTKYVVDKLSHHFTAAGFETDAVSMDAKETTPIDFSDVAYLGIAYPVHAFNAPELVVNYVRQLALPEGMKVFISYTAGEDATINYAASRILQKLLQRKGCELILNKLIPMPSNFAVRHTDAEAAELLAHADAETERIVSRILNRETQFDRAPAWVSLMAALGKAEWPGARAVGKAFYSTEDCIACGICVQDCPKRNIRLSEQTLTFGWSCCLCMRCVYSCPKNAIQIRKPFRFFKINPWYDLDV